MRTKIVTIGLIFIATSQMYSQEADTLAIEIINGEYWWGGLSTEGYNTP